MKNETPVAAIRELLRRQWGVQDILKAIAEVCEEHYVRTERHDWYMRASVLEAIANAPPFAELQQ